MCESITSFLVFRHCAPDMFYLAGANGDMALPCSELPDGYGLGCVVDYELNEDGELQMLAEQNNVEPCIGKVVDDEFYVLLTIDISYDAFNKVWRGYCPELGNIYVPDTLEWPKKLDFDISREKFYIRHITSPITTLHMGTVSWMLMEHVPKKQPETKEEKVVVPSPWIEEMDNPVYPGEAVGVVVGMTDDGLGAKTAFIFTKDAGYSTSDPRIVRASGLEVGDWIAFDPLQNKFVIKSYRKIISRLPVKQVQKTVKVKIENVDITNEVLENGFFVHEYLGAVSNERDVLQTGRGFTVIAERQKPTEEGQHQWIATQLIIPPLPICRPECANTQILCYSAIFGTAAFSVNKELLAYHSPYLKNKFASNTTEGAKYDVIGNPKAITRVLEILHFCDLRDTEFLEHDYPFIDFWKEMYDFLEIVFTWQIPPLTDFISQKMLVYHCEDKYCTRCVHRAAFAHSEDLIYPDKNNVNKMTVDLWLNKYSTEFLEAFPNKQIWLSMFLDCY